MMIRRMLTIVLLGGLCCPSNAATHTVRIELLGRTEVSSGVTKVSDVARVSGGDLITRRKIADLDIANFEATTSSKQLSRHQIQLRILLAGFAKGSFQLTGAKTVMLRVVKATSPETRILELLKPEIANRLKITPADIVVRLAKPIPIQVNDYFVTTNTLEHSLPNVVNAGVLQTRIRIRDQKRLIRTLPVSVEIKVYRSVFVARRQLEAGDTLNESDVVQERRLTDNRQQATKPEIGKQLKRTVMAGAIVTNSDVDQATQKREIVVRSRDIVEIVARSSTLQARVSGAIALERGAIGDNIRVKNPNSKNPRRILNAKVVSSGVVEIRL